MTRDEFMGIAEAEITAIMASQKNRIMNVIERAWAEGKKNAESDAVFNLVKEAIERAEKNVPYTLPTWPLTTQPGNPIPPVWYGTNPTTTPIPPVSCDDTVEVKNDG